MSSAAPSPSRRPTPIDAIAERWVDTLVDLDPSWAVWLGRPSPRAGFADYSPDGQARYVDAVRSVLAELEEAQPVDDVDRVTLDDLSSSLRLDLEYDAQRLHLRDLNVIASPAQAIREVFDLMPTGSIADWQAIADRLATVEAALEHYTTTLVQGIDEGIVPARRQVAAVAEQCARHTAPDGFFATFASDPEVDSAEPVPEALRDALAANASAASAAYVRFREFLLEQLLPAATERDGVGREAYALHSRRFLGATVDLDETYEWGLAEVARMTAEQAAVAESIEAGASVERAIEILDQDPARSLSGTDALQAWMQQVSDEAVDELGRTHFDIPDAIRTLECRIAPTQDGGVYYTAPSDDFTRPGRMWWSVPVGKTTFTTWRERTTVYHEGVPGHHLQLGQAVYNRATLNTYRRSVAGTSGHAEGWALYAERLMDELGYLSDPADRLGMLDGQRMRAARVVIDLGVHLGKQFPGCESFPAGGVWDHERAMAYLHDNAHEDEGTRRFEVDRYLGWPGQAPSYKIGQRVWEELRAELATRAGSASDVKRFHSDALALGGVGLDTLRRALLGG
jgi:uncharacterized protein (DUF885 family)